MMFPSPSTWLETNLNPPQSRILMDARIATVREGRRRGWWGAWRNRWIFATSLWTRTLLDTPASYFSLPVVAVFARAPSKSDFTLFFFVQINKCSKLPSALSIWLCPSKVHGIWGRLRGQTQTPSKQGICLNVSELPTNHCRSCSQISSPRSEKSQAVVFQCRKCGS